MTPIRPIPYPVPEEDYLFPPEVATTKVRARCHCGVRSVKSFRIVVDFAHKVLRGDRIAPTDLAGSAWCSTCKTVVKVTARALHLA